MGNEKYNAVKCHAWGKLRQEARKTPSLSPHPPPIYQQFTLSGATSKAASTTLIPSPLTKLISPDLLLGGHPAILQGKGSTGNLSWPNFNLGAGLP